MQARNPIHFHSEEVDFELSDPITDRNWILDILNRESRRCGELNFIFCSDDYLLGINREYLDHDYFTDIITFNYNKEDKISGDIYISVDRVRENATQLHVPVGLEIKRVMIHGILHLIGYDDKNPESQAKMRAQEDFCLTLHPLIKN